ncbi:taurine dioxygenase [Caulobacter ginsengisoli]|uniref:Taurine dioxygenase n=1 Tax=Caulobacter ginsengisoli TaxID=400775 RepID=A0ABU0IRC2_9CAUL|nr:TauD/TfdA family dioxygenase [Caulobacter ginsengisoli]MDQ0464560.1 taurine dioxygenase [Caulobacter ginsengisoli]
MSITVTANPSGFGAEITGLDISRPLPADTLAEVKAAWAAHSVVWFPDQPLDHDQLEAFTLQFGGFGHDPYVKPLADRPHILEVRREPTETASVFGGAWHSDWSFQPAPPAATILHAKIVPPVGGDTEFADAYRAYETLSPVMQKLLSGLTTIHSATRPYGAQGVYAYEPAGHRSMEIINCSEADAQQEHPLVRVHPVSGRKSLFVNPIYTLGIAGMTEAESGNLLGFLYKHMLQEAFIYRHKWRPDMLIMWDNRCALHNATGGYDGHRRVMHRVTVAGETPIAA